MDTGNAVIIFLGALAGGLVNGLTGFGTGLTALGFWLYALEPGVASTLVLICSVVSQLQTLPMVWRSIKWERVLPLLIPGVLGVPLGTYLLPYINPRVFKLGIGLFLIAYCAYGLWRTREVKSDRGGAVADGVVGFIGGILGGLTGISGAVVIVLTDLRGWTKDHRRGVIQAFNISILSLALASHAVAGLLTQQVALAALIALPGTIGGARLGGAIYRRLADRGYRRVVLVLLLLSGAGLIWASW
jgi:hypothetical protein